MTMDAIELGRRRAADLHYQAVARGLNPEKPYDFARGEATHRGLDVETANPGSSSLNGGRATLVGDLIIHENTGSPFEQAFLVAHEIGHHELGDAEDETSPSDIDMNRPAEASPQGADRVVDYSRRQRREVQMDLFAREFLLPRSLMRRLHLDQGESASAIAKRLNAPFEVVAQQLADALFLPVSEAKQTSKTENPLNAGQEAAAGHRGEAYILEAGPGTGKTQTLTARVVQLLEEGVDPRRILVLTYSNKAAGEMAERIAVKKPLEAAAMWIGTFHAFGLDLIRRLSTEFDLPDNPRMMDRVDAVELLEADFPKFKLDFYRDLYDPTRIIGDILSAISRAKDEVKGPADYEQAALTMLEAAGNSEPRRTRALQALEVAHVYHAYEAIKKRHKALDFGDLVSLPVELLEDRDDVAQQMRLLYDHILVDEYQDVNRASVRLLKALCPSGKNLWVVGDARQSIYRFRGAAPINMSKFLTHDFVGGKSGRLTINYRSSQEIVTGFSTFGQDMGATASDASLTAHRGPSNSPLELRLTSRKEDQIVAIADCIAERHQAGVSYREQAVLCTGNERLGEIARDLERMNIPVLFLGSLFERGEIKDLLSLLSLLADSRAVGLVRVACIPEFAMPLGDVGKIYEKLQATSHEPLDWLTDRPADLSLEGGNALDRLAVALNGFDASSSPWHVLATVLFDRTRIAARLGSSTNVQERSQGIALWQMLNFLRVQPGGQGQPIPRLLERIRRLVSIGDDRDLRQLPEAAQGLDAVRLMTIHGAKGLEFSCVHLPGLNQDTLPGNAKIPQCIPAEGIIEGVEGDVAEALKAGDKDERECLFYVGLSRARDRLFLYAVTERTDGAARALSSYLPRVGTALQRTTPSLVRSLGSPPDHVPITIVFPSAISFSDSQVAMLEQGKCQRRFFYTHLLKIGGKRTETPFMKMHEAARTVVRSMVKGRLDVTTDEALQAAVAQACLDNGLDETGNLAELQAAAVAMVTYFRDSRAYPATVEPAPLKIAFGRDEITFRPDDMAVPASGNPVYYRVRTGRFRESDTKDLGVATALMAIEDNAPGGEVKVMHLSGRTTTSLSMTRLVLGRRRAALQQALQDIRTGVFPAGPDQRVCPRCPAFFACGPVPPGTLTRNFLT